MSMGRADRGGEIGGGVVGGCEGVGGAGGGGVVAPELVERGVGEDVAVVRGGRSVRD